MSILKALDKWTGGGIADWLAGKMAGYEVIGTTEIDLATVTISELDSLKDKMRPEDFRALVKMVAEYRSG